MSDTPITDVAEDQVHTFANGTMVVASNIARGLERKLTAAIAKLEETKVIYQLSPVDIYSFAGWLTTRPVTLTVGAEHKCYPIAEAVGEYLKTFPERFTASPMHDKVQELERELAAVTAERDALRAALAEAEKEEPVAWLRQDRPSVLFRPHLSIDGNQWCALYGDNLQDGVAGFGDSPEAAMRDFDQAWSKKLGAGR